MPRFYLIKCPPTQAFGSTRRNGLKRNDVTINMGENAQLTAHVRCPTLTYWTNKFKVPATDYHSRRFRKDLF
jgi:hypothetical protein